MKRVSLPRIIRELGRGEAASLVALLVRHLEVTLAGVRVARDVSAGTLPPAQAGRRMRDIEHEGDGLRAQLASELSGVMVTPIDREDLFRLSRSIDDVLDNLRDFTREWSLYKVRTTDAFVPLLDAVGDAVGSLRDAVATIARDPSRTVAAALTTKKACNRIRRSYQREVARLFAGELTMELLKRRELLRRLDVVGLRLDEAVDVLSDASVKRQA